MHSVLALRCLASEATRFVAKFVTHGSAMKIAAKKAVSDENSSATTRQTETPEPTQATPCAELWTSDEDTGTTELTAITELRRNRRGGQEGGHVGKAQ